MKSTKAREYLRAHVLGLVAIFIALTGTAVAANGGQSGGNAKATAAVSTQKLLKKVKKLNQRVSALEAAPKPVIPTTLPPSGPAGGSLAGSYPNPSIAGGAVVASTLGTIVTRTNSTTVNNGASGTVSANCNAGERIISGGGVFLIIGLPAETVPITRSIKTGTAGSPGNGWQVSADNASGANGALVAQAYCLQ